MNMRQSLLILLFLLSGYLSAYAQHAADTTRVKIYFRQGYSTLEPSYRDNAANLQVLIERLRAVERDPSCRVRNIRIVSSASPEGSDAMNKRLSARRAERVRSFIVQRASLDNSLFEVRSLGVDWQGLIRLVEASDMPYRAEALDILHHAPEWIVRNGVVVGGRKQQLGMLRGGRVWKYMEEHFFPELRSSTLDVVCRIERLPVENLPDTVVVEHRDTVVHVQRDTIVLRDTVHLREEVVPVRKPFYMALKTNLLYDAALVPNIGAEFYVGRGWSVGGNWMYAWWKSDKRHRYWRAYGGELDIRKYFGRRAAGKPLTGHHIGLYGQMATYDFEIGGKGYMGGKPGGTLFNKANYGVGIEYGYSLPIGRRLNLDFGIGIGYFGGEYWVYDPIDTHYVWRETKKRRWFGPTKAEISLVWLIGRGNYNEKGGKR